MQAYDLIMLIIIGMATLFGAIKGFAWQVASIASIVVSYVVAYRFRFDLAEMIQAKPPWNLFLAMLILFVGTSFVIWVAFRIFSGMIDKVRLKEFDRQLGAAFGLGKGLIYCLLVTMFAMSLLGPNQQQAICESQSGYYIAKALDHGMGVLPKELHDVVGPYLAQLDSKLKNGQQAGDSDATASDWGNGFDSLPSLTGGLVDSVQGLVPADGFSSPGNGAQSGGSTWSQPNNFNLENLQSGLQRLGVPEFSNQNNGSSSSAWGANSGSSLAPAFSNPTDESGYSGRVLTNEASSQRPQNFPPLPTAGNQPTTGGVFPQSSYENYQSNSGAILPPGNTGASGLRPINQAGAFDPSYQQQAQQPDRETLPR